MAEDASTDGAGRASARPRVEDGGGVAGSGRRRREVGQAAWRGRCDSSASLAGSSIDFAVKPTATFLALPGLGPGGGRVAGSEIPRHPPGGWTGERMRNENNRIAIYRRTIILLTSLASPAFSTQK